MTEAAGPEVIRLFTSLTDKALAQPPSQWCQVFFLGAAGFVIALQALPRSLRSILMDYGARSTDKKTAAVDGGKKTSPTTTAATTEQLQASSGLKTLLSTVTSIGQVPHSWFWHFYLASVACSAFWAWQFLGRGRVMGALAEMQRAAVPTSLKIRAATAAMTTAQGRDIIEAGLIKDELGRVFAAWVMMTLQGCRRLYESCFVMRSGSASSMWFVHWVLGLAFYAVMSISVWIEGSDAILESWKTQDPTRILSSRVPSAMAIYFWAWVKQNECHSHLAGLKKYTLPTAGLFRFLVCPHYTCECLIYLTIAFVAAPTGRWFSGPVICGLAFVAANLGTTAIGTRRWYAQKFGSDAVASRWVMIPFVF